MVFSYRVFALRFSRNPNTLHFPYHQAITVAYAKLSALIAQMQTINSYTLQTKSMWAVQYSLLSILQN